MDSLAMERRSPKSPLPKSSFPKSPMSKSPFPKSPMPKSPVLYEKYKSRCAYGFISFFRFRQRHSKRLISGRRHLKNHGVGDGHARNKHGAVSHIDRKCHSIDDRLDHKTVTVHSSNVEVKKIASEDMPLEQNVEKISSAKLEYSKSGPLHVKSQNYRRTTNTTRRPRRLPIYGCYDVATMGNTEHIHNLADRSSRKLDSGEVLNNQLHPKSVKSMGSDPLSEVNLQLHMSAETEAFINQKLIDGKHLSEDGPNDQSRHFMDALEILNSNKELFIKLLQDPNSLLVKHIEDLRDSQSKQQQTRSFIGCDGCMFEGTNDSQSMERIVVLRPGTTSLQDFGDERINNESLQFHYRLRKVQQSVRPASFSFVKMKRKLMNAMGASRKEKQLAVTDVAVSDSTYVAQGHGKYSRDAGNDCSENIYSGFEATAFSRDGKKDQMDKAKNIEVGAPMQVASASESQYENSNLSIAMLPKRNNHETFVESLMNLSKPLNSGNANVLRRRRPKIGNGTNSASEYNMLLDSPRMKREDDLVTPEMRFCPNSSFEMLSMNNQNHRRENKNNFRSPLKQQIVDLSLDENKKNTDQLKMLETKLSIADKLFRDETMDNISFLDNDLSPRGFGNFEEANDHEISEVISHSRVSLEPDSPQNSGANQSTCAADTSAKYGSLDFLRRDLPADNQISSPSSTIDYSSRPSSIHRVETVDKIRDRLEQPSPVSVLQQFSMEDISSPLSTETKTPEPSILPQRLGLDEDYVDALLHFPLSMTINSLTSKGEHWSILEYKCAVLQSSGINLDELSLKCHLSDQLLNESSENQKLLSDYFIEVLLELYERHFSFFPWLSLFKPKLGLVPKTESAVHEVMGYVNRDSLSKPPSQSLEQLLEKDVTKPGTWMDIRTEAEDIVNATAECILEDFIIETITE